MKRSTFNFWIDLVSIAVFFQLTLTGLLIYYVLPPCGDCTGQTTGCKTASILWGLSRHDYGRIHFYLALASIALIVVHTALHWSWVCNTCCNVIGIKSASPDKQSVIGILLLVCLMGAMIGLLLLAKQQVG